MKIIDVLQGSERWLAIRARHFTASEAPIMMGASTKASRNDLLRMKATGDVQEYSRWVKEVLFERGHEIEVKARPFAEKIIGEELFPVTATDDEGYLLASFDGITLLEDVIWECKQWNAAKEESVRAGRCPQEDYYQVVQQLAVSGAERCLYMVSDGTEAGTVHLWVGPRPADIARLIAGWEQFAVDLAAYEPRHDPAQPVGRAPESLPALHIEVKGMVTASNLAEFKAHALSVFRAINTDLQTDEHFADAEKTIKWCADVESRLDAAKAHALSQTASIDELFRTIDLIREEARVKRLDLDRLVKARKQAIRGEILQEAKLELAEHIAEINMLIEPVRLPEIEADFAWAMKGKRVIKSLRDGVDAELARAKIAASSASQKISRNLASFNELAKGRETLFRDLQALVLKEPDDLAAIIKTRIAEHEAAEKARLEAERERIRAEERERAERLEREARAAEERQRAEDERKQREAQEDVRRAKARVEMEAAREVSEPIRAMTEPLPPSAPAVCDEEAFDDEEPFGDEAAQAPSKPAWVVTCTFETSAPAGVSPREIESELRRVLESAGIRTLVSVRAVRKQESNAA